MRKIFKSKRFKLVINLSCSMSRMRYSLKNPREYLKSNLLGFFNIINLCKEFRIKRIVYASTSIYGNNLKTPFKESHTADHPIQFYAAKKIK